MDDKETSAVDAMLDRVVAEAEVEELAPGDEAELSGSEVEHLLVHRGIIAVGCDIHRRE